jgi:hypothetical protein
MNEAKKTPNRERAGSALGQPSAGPAVLGLLPVLDLCGARGARSDKVSSLVTEH